MRRAVVEDQDPERLEVARVAGNHSSTQTPGDRGDQRVPQARLASAGLGAFTATVAGPPGAIGIDRHVFEGIEEGPNGLLLLKVAAREGLADDDITDQQASILLEQAGENLDAGRVATDVIDGNIQKPAAS